MLAVAVERKNAREDRFGLTLAPGQNGGHTRSNRSLADTELALARNQGRMAHLDSLHVGDRIVRPRLAVKRNAQRARSRLAGGLGGRRLFHLLQTSPRVLNLERRDARRPKCDQRVHNEENASRSSHQESPKLSCLLIRENSTLRLLCNAKEFPSGRPAITERQLLQSPACSSTARSGTANRNRRTSRRYTRSRTPTPSRCCRRSERRHTSAPP